MSSNKLIKVEVKAAADSKMFAENEVTKHHAGKRGAASHTVTAKFKSQLSHLMHDIAKTKTRYIRCIKPNPEKAPLKMHMASSAEQLRCAGVVAAVAVSRVAFPNRLMHETALQRFSCLEHVEMDAIVDEEKEETDDDPTGFKESVSALLTTVLKELEVEVEGEDGVVTKAFEAGKSRVYFRSGALEFLEAKRLVALGAFAITIERIVRGFTSRSIFWKIKYAAIDSQANSRRTTARKLFLRMKLACISIECWTRCVFAERELKRLQQEAASIKLQSRWRSIRASLMLAKCKEAAITIQKTARVAIQRPKYRTALKEAEEEARVNTKVAALQKRLQEAEMKWIQADKKRIEAEKRAQGIGGQGVSHPERPTTPTRTTDKAEKKAETQSPVNQQALIDESNE
jgi:myosin-5